VSSSFPTARFPAVPFGREKLATESVSEDGFVLSEVPSDEALISRISSDDSEALGLFFSRYARLVWTIGRRILRHNEEADDLLQDVFLLVRRKATAFEPSKGSVRSLLVQMCYQRAFSRRRDLARRNFYSDRDATGNTVVASRSSSPSYDESLEARVGRATLKKALEDLTTEQRETIHLCFFEGFTLEEIAERLGLSYGNVRHHYYRGLAKLRKHVASE
jgi:RNA polymerase sigma-70 factor (ECF subfamily)